MHVYVFSPPQGFEPMYPGIWSHDTSFRVTLCLNSPLSFTALANLHQRFSCVPFFCMGQATGSSISFNVAGMTMFLKCSAFCRLCQSACHLVSWLIHLTTLFQLYGLCRW
jgi:hypothetical protein